MAVATQEFFKYIDEFFTYRHNIYEVSGQTTKSNRVDLNVKVTSGGLTSKGLHKPQSNVNCDGI